MKYIGFSTGALARGDFRRALQMLSGKKANAVELSALRQHELAPLVQQLEQLDLSRPRPSKASRCPYTLECRISSRVLRSQVLEFLAGFPIVEQLKEPRVRPK